VPTYSWPIVVPGSTGTRPWKMWRSEPQMPLASIAMIASSGLVNTGPETSSIRTSPGAW